MVLHHNHSLLTRYDFCHSCIVMFPPIDVPCLLGPPDRGTKKKGEKPTKPKKNQYVRTLSAEAPSSKTSGFFVFFFETQDYQTSGKLYSFVFMNAQSIWSYLKCLYLWQNFQKNICKPGRKNTESGAATFYCCRVVGPNLFTVFTVFYAHYAEDHLPKSNGRETIHLSDLSLSGFYDVIHT